LFIRFTASALVNFGSNSIKVHKTFGQWISFGTTAKSP